MRRVVELIDVVDEVRDENMSAVKVAGTVEDVLSKALGRLVPLLEPKSRLLDQV